MSDIADKTIKRLAEEAELDKKKKELQSKELLIRDRKASIELERIAQVEKELEIAKNTNFNEMSLEQIEQLRKDNAEYMESARNCMEFINESFRGAIPYFRKNVILIGGKTGEGKSTAVANIVLETMKQKNPSTNKPRRVLVITNEEKSEDVYNRVTCLIKGWHYTNHDQFTEEQKVTFDEYIKMLSSNGRLTVVDDSYNGAFGLTTTIEGIETIFDNLIRDEIYYDAVIIDYYQNVKFSKKNPYLDEYEVQAKLARSLDRYKNVYPAPIVVMAQVNPPDKEKKTPFQYRIQGRKVIMTTSTVAIEMVADRENLRTEWVIHKSRFNEAVGKAFYTGYFKGKFVNYDIDFIKKVAKLKEEREYKKVYKNIFEEAKNDDERD